MTIRLSRAEYWLLESVSELSYPVQCLFGDAVESAFNKPGHGLGDDEILAVLFELHACGRLFLTVREEGVRLDSVDGLRALVDRDADVDSRLYYGLTPSGAEMFEAFALPDWQRYILYCCEEEDEETYLIEAYCMDRRLLSLYVDALERECEWLDRDAAVLEEVGSWDATYWKTLPQGWRYTFRRSANTRLLAPGSDHYHRFWYRWG